MSNRLRLFKQALSPVSAVAMRGLGLVARLSLAVYLARYLDLSSVGVFGLIAGLVGIAPTFFSWGVNYFLGRELVDLPLPMATRMIRDRLALTFVALAAGGFLATVLLLLGLTKATPIFAVVACIVALDCVASDIHVALVSLRMPLLANLLLFLRSSAWAFPVIGFGVAFPTLRSLEFLIWMWLSGSILSFCVLGVAIRDWPIVSTMRQPIDWPLIGNWLRKAGLIYLSELGVVGALYLDRYVVGHFLGLEAAGIFTLYWSVANGMHVLVNTGILQSAVPRLVSANATQDKSGWLVAMRSELRKIVIVTLMLMALLYLFVSWGAPLLGQARLSSNLGLFVLMLVAVALRLLSDLANYGLYSRGLDRAFTVVNILGLLLSLLLSVLGILVLGMIGIGIAMICVATFTLALRLYLLRRHWFVSHGQQQRSDVASD